MSSRGRERGREDERERAADQVGSHCSGGVVPRSALGASEDRISRREAGNHGSRAVQCPHRSATIHPNSLDLGSWSADAAARRRAPVIRSTRIRAAVHFLLHPSPPLWDPSQPRRQRDGPESGQRKLHPQFFHHHHHQIVAALGKRSPSAA